MLQSGLIKPEDLHRKYTQELFANEIVLLSYYIAAINIESVYAEEAAKHGVEQGYVPFEGIALTDTFQLNEDDGKMDSNGFFPENHERVKRQKNAPIKVIVMNPPYSGGQTSANDNNQNQKYPALDASIAESYAKESTATLKYSLYDSYIRGIRWATNRIQGDGVIAFVSNGSFIDSGTADGIRKTFVAEFSRIFVYNLRGGIRGRSGDAAKREGANVFPIMTPVAITILIKNSSHKGPADIQYRDIGDYLTREQKLDVLGIEQSFEGTEWETIVPNQHNDWVNQRDQKYDTYQPIGDKSTKGKKTTSGIFGTFSLGVSTNRDAWCYGSSEESSQKNINKFINAYNTELHSSLNSEKYLRNLDPTKIAWSTNLESSFKQGKTLKFDRSNYVQSMYRPFYKQFLYKDHSLIERPGQLTKMFPTSRHPNLAIGTSGERRKDWSCFVISLFPDLELISKAQWFSLYTYEPIDTQVQEDLFVDLDSKIIDGYRRKENITDAALETYGTFYSDSKISKEDIFYYVYGLMHSPTYRVEYKADLMKMLPRIPKVKDFWGFSSAGRSLADLHLNYETIDPFPLEELSGTPLMARDDDYEFYSVKKLSFASRKDRSKIVYNKHITLTGIPDEAYDYQINGKSALEWIIDRYQTTTHKASQITNDPNDYSREIGNPRYIIDLIKRIVTVSVETNKIVAALPELDIIE